MTNPPDLASDDPRLLLLDEYLTRLQAGEAPPREQFLKDHPELAELLTCLDALDRLALPAAPDELATLPFAGTTTLQVALPETPGARRFGNYELLEELGRGGMGVVYQARQLGLNRLVAVKMILGSALATEEQVSRFQREARAAATVQHPHIVRIFDVGAVEGQHYFAMEYVAGPSLSQALRQGLPEPQDAAQLLVAVAHAVAHLHEHGIIHRDLKPGNVLLAEITARKDAKTQRRGDQEAGDNKAATLPASSASLRLCERYLPKLTDFGLARLRDEATGTTTGTVLGTPSYMPPEQASGRQDRVGPHSDIYSLGAILYEMLTGRPPFQSNAPLNTILQVLENEPEPPHRRQPSVPADLELICLKCLEKEPERRYASATELADDLDRFLDGDPVTARPDTFFERCGRWMRQEPIMAARVFALTLCAVVLQLSFAFRTDIDAAYHWGTLGLLGGWLAGSLACWRWVREGAGDLGRLLWLGLDVVGLTLVLIRTGADPGPLVMGYALIVALSGLWFRPSLVWRTTALCELAHAVLVGYGYLTRGVVEGKHYPVICAVLLLLVGAVVAWQVRRIRFLSQRWLEP